MRRLLVSSTFLLIAVLGMSQVGYPKLTLINGDSLILFTPKQVSKINVTFLELDRNIALNESLTGELELFKVSVDNLKKLVEQGEDRHGILYKLYNEKVLQVKLLTEDVEKKDRRLKLLKKSRTLYVIGGAILGGVATYYLKK